MAKRKAPPAAAVAAAAAAIEAARDEVVLESDDEAADVADALSALRQIDAGEGAVWEVHCIEHRTREAGYIDKIAPADLDCAYFKRKYGPGKYKVMAKVHGKYVRGTHATVTISDIGAPDETQPSAPPADAAAVLKQFLETQAAQRNAEAASRRDLILGLATPAATLAAAILNRPRAPAIDPAIVAALAGKQSTLAELTTALTNIEQLRGGRGNPDVVDTALKLLDKFKDLPQGETSTGSTWVDAMRDLLRELAPAATEFMKRAAEQRQGAPAPGAPARVPYPGPAPAPSPRTFIPPGGVRHPQEQIPPGTLAHESRPPVDAPAPAVPPETSAAGSPEEMMQKMIEPWLRKQCERITEWAQNNVDGELCAEMLLAEIPAMYRSLVTDEQLLEWVSKPDWWPVVAEFHPPILPYQAWATDLREQLLALLRDEDDADGEEPAAVSRAN